MPNILVCVKAVPGTSQVQVDGQFRLKRDGVNLQWNIADESALEAALQQKGGGTVTLLSMGPKKLEESLRELLNRGADRVVLITDPAMAGADTHATAKALAEAARKLGPFDLILCGRRAVDGETGQVPSQLAAALELPCVTNVEKISLSDEVRLVRRLEGGTETLQGKGPMVVSICEYSYPLRLPGILSMRRAKGKQVETFSAKDLEMEREQCGLSGSLTKVASMSAQFPGLRQGPKETDISKAASTLLELCKEVGS